MKIPTALLLLFLLSSCGNEATGIRPELKTITEAVYASATVLPQDAYTVYAQVNGIIEYSNLREGALVNKGDELFRISNEVAELETKKARQNYAHARESYQGNAAILEEMDERLRSAGMGLANDSLNYARLARLWQQDIGSKQALEMAELKYNTSRIQLTELRKAYERTRRELADQFALAGTSLEISGQQSGNYQTRAELSGTVYEVLKQVGESVTTQTPVARIGSTDDFILELLIDEVDIAKVQIGQSVIVVLDAYRDQTYAAVVTNILPHKDDRSQTFTVEAVFTQPPERLYDGLSGEANIVLSRRERTLTLPSELIGPDNTVITAEGKRSVVTGISDLRYTEILSGLDTSTLVYQVE